jgi:hypothetical protein
MPHAHASLTPLVPPSFPRRYLTGKGDGNIRYFEFTDEAPFVFLLSEFRSNVSLKGADMLPKRGLNILGCETARMLKLTSNLVEPIPFCVPRKEQSFQADIFPDTFAGVPAMSAEAWFGGKNVAGPTRISLDPAKNGSIAKASGDAPASSPRVSLAAAASGAAAGGAASASSASASSADAELAAALAKIAALTKENAALKGELASAKAAAEGAGAGAAGGSSEELEAARARIAELETSEAKLKKAVAALSN